MGMVKCPAPEFDCPAIMEGELVQYSWKELHGHNWLVLVFDPMDFTGDAADELFGFTDASRQFARLNTNVALVGMGSVYEQLARVNQSRAQGGLEGFTFPIIVDSDHRIARLYDMELDTGRTLRGHYIIDPSGIIRQTVISDQPVGRNVQEILRFIESLCA